MPARAGRTAGSSPNVVFESGEIRAIPDGGTVTGGMTSSTCAGLMPPFLSALFMAAAEAWPVGSGSMGDAAALADEPMPAISA